MTTDHSPELVAALNHALGTALADLDEALEFVASDFGAAVLEAWAEDHLSPEEN